MGLDCTAYSHLELLPDVNDDWDDENRIHAFAYAGFERSTRGLADHDVKNERWGHTFIACRDYSPTEATKTYGWQAGSYSGYGAFRRALAALNGHSAEDYWHEDVPESEPFYELVNFADNEGCIGPEAASDLLADFEQHRDQFHKAHAEHPWFPSTYDEWITALRLAADEGLVRFH